MTDYAGTNLALGATADVRPLNSLLFVRCGGMLLRCGSAFAQPPPSLGVSSLDLGRLQPRAAFFWRPRQTAQNGSTRHSLSVLSPIRRPSPSSAIPPPLGKAAVPGPAGMRGDRPGVRG